MFNLNICIINYIYLVLTKSSIDQTKNIDKIYKGNIDLNLIYVVHSQQSIFCYFPLLENL